MQGSFVQRLLRVTVQLAPDTGTNQPNTFAGTNSNAVQLSGSRTSVRIQNSGAPANSTAQVKIWGLTPSLMNELTTLGLVYNLVTQNQLTVEAGSADSNGNPADMAVVFAGNIWQAYADYGSQPDVPFILECQSAAGVAAINAPTSSFTGQADVATIMAGLARGMNLGFKNNGVTASIANAYLEGSFWVQAQTLAEWAGIQWGIINGNTLEIWPKGGNRDTQNVPIISAATGMISYPAFTQQGIIVKTLFNPQISFGSLIQVESSLLSTIAAVKPKQTNAFGETVATFPSRWAANKVDLVLDSLVPKGEWMSIVYAYNPGYARTILPPA